MDDQPEAISISDLARKAKVTRQAVSIALDSDRLTAVQVIGRRAVAIDHLYRKFLKSTRNRTNAKAKKK